MNRSLTYCRKFAILCHRWMGVAFCLLFGWWFVSGIFMMYWDFPSVNPEDRLQAARPLNPTQIKLSPDEAFAALRQDRPAASAQLSMFDGRPVYRFSIGGGPGGRAAGARAQSLVYADDGSLPGECTDVQALRIAASWSRQVSGPSHVEELTDVDQWTIQGQFRRLWPLIKFSWPNGEQTYVSLSNCEVVQHTTRRSRIFAHLGAIPHWLYYTPLRKNGPLWSKIVIWSSGAATAAALLGLLVGISMYSPFQRYRYFGQPTGIPYRGQKRLHMIFGLFFGIVACTWAFSGMLSMDPFPATTGGGGISGARIATALRGGRFQLKAFAKKHPRNALSQVAATLSVKQLDFVVFVDEPVYLATQDAHHTRIIPMDSEPIEEFDWNRMMEVLDSASGQFGLSELRVITEYDAYYLDRLKERPLPVILARFNDPDRTRFYVDPRTARIVGSYSSRSWMNRWLYHGLHSLNFPWLYEHRPAWDIVVISLLVGGTALSATSVILAWRVVRRKRVRGADEDSLAEV